MVTEGDRELAGWGESGEGLGAGSGAGGGDSMGRGRGGQGEGTEGEGMALTGRALRQQMQLGGRRGRTKMLWDGGPGGGAEEEEAWGTELEIGGRCDGSCRRQEQGKKRD